MLATYVLPETTPLPFDVAASAMRSALFGALGSDPPANVLALALGKTALETGRWQHMWNGNWGNIKCSDSYDGLFTCITLNERMGAGVVWYAPQGELNRQGGTVIGKLYEVPDGHPQTRMRAYRTPEEGAADYIAFVVGGRYAAAWQQLLRGDAAGYVHALKLAKYFTADEAAYMKGVVSLQAEFMRRLVSAPLETPPPPVPVPPPDEVRGWLSRQDIAVLEAELAERYFDVLSDRSDRDADIQGDDA